MHFSASILGGSFPLFPSTCFSEWCWGQSTSNSSNSVQQWHCRHNCLEKHVLLGVFSALEPCSRGCAVQLYNGLAYVSGEKQGAACYEEQRRETFLCP